MQIFLTLLWKLIYINSDPKAGNLLTFPKHFRELHPQELYGVFTANTGEKLNTRTREGAGEGGHVKINRTHGCISLFKKKLRMEETTISPRATTVMALSILTH